MKKQTNNNQICNCCKKKVNKKIAVIETTSGNYFCSYKCLLNQDKILKGGKKKDE